MDQQRVLAANNEPRVEEIHSQPHNVLIERAGKVTDDAIRQCYLENVAANREISDAFNQRT